MAAPIRGVPGVTRPMAASRASTPITAIPTKKMNRASPWPRKSRRSLLPESITAATTMATTMATTPTPTIRRVRGSADPLVFSAGAYRHQHQPPTPTSTPAAVTIPNPQSAPEPLVVSRPAKPATPITAPATDTARPAGWRPDGRRWKVRSSTPQSRAAPPNTNRMAQAQSRPSQTWELRIHSAPKMSFQNSYPGASSRPSTMTLLVNSLEKLSLPPMRTKNVPSVTMKLGSDVLSTMVPLNQPTIRAKASPSGTAMCSDSPAPPNSPISLLNSTTTMAVAPVMAPEDRSNSPPIISRATGTAMMPKVAATSKKLAVPPTVPNRSDACQNRIHTDRTPSRAPISGRVRTCCIGALKARRSSPAPTPGSGPDSGLSVSAVSSATKPPFAPLCGYLSSTVSVCLRQGRFP